jgi:deoxycytidine triphosphate deaminase
MLDRPCAAVVFSTGERIVADLAHQWVTASKYDRRIGRTRICTTEQIGRTLRERNEYRHHVPMAEPVQYETKDLPIDPYVFGVWLGDGTSTTAEITCADPEILREIEAAGYRVEPATAPLAWRIGGTGEARVRDAAGRYGRDGSLSSTLRTMGQLGDKHVPRAYLLGDIAQRTALLQGLMDSDGSCDEYGRCEFVSTKEHLADAVVRLAASLGLRPKKRKKTAYLNGVDCGPAYQVKFTPDQPVFRLRRKLARQKLTTARFHRFRSIVAVESAPSVPVKCIQVGAADGVFLAGEHFIPTHNSSLGRLGLLIHSTAGFVDAGWDGHLTLELSNVANLPITLYPAMKIGQISFLQMTTAADNPYGSSAVGSKYKGQRGPTPSRYFENFRKR